MQSKPARKNSGFTLIELMITLLVLAIVASIALPSMSSFFDRHRVISAAEELYGLVQQARTESLARSTPIYLVFSADGTDNWRYGMSQTQGCDPSVASHDGTDACVIVVSDGDGNLDPGDGSVDTGDLMLMVFDNQDHQGVLMSIVGGGSSEEMEISNRRGVIEDAWGNSPYALEFTSPQGKNLRIQVGKLGQVRLCTPDDSVGGYSSC
ncbi:GspH/FimT family pseudopilin [Marinobacter sp. G11]|uniref:pilus assembly FimT family protein n=1 Tax=Marinobacter sp. G11 TaxID=2903522 RepID=UPI001E53A84B|nr:GspH/FimT family pseudopilin [Marinobacter sp. G11]MCE0758774.1 GspH/FimT family pseudopilin [Marinobacter sp. G11]